MNTKIKYNCHYAFCYIGFLMSKVIFPEGQTLMIERPSSEKVQMVTGPFTELWRWIPSWRSYFQCFINDPFWTWTGGHIAKSNGHWEPRRRFSLWCPAHRWTATKSEHAQLNSLSCFAPAQRLWRCWRKMLFKYSQKILNRWKFQNYTKVQKT